MQLNIIPNILANQIMAVIAMSMVYPHLLLLINERIIYPNTRTKEKETKKRMITSMKIIQLS
jgi:CPA2 family monovalent cation:H+ antiporter-2